MTIQTTKLTHSTVVRVYPNKAFVLTARKLGRIVEVARERIEKVRNGLPVFEQFTVTFANSKEATLGRIEDVLALDNGVKNGIVEIRYLIWVEQGEFKIHWVEIHYNAASSNRPVRIAAGSNDMPWVGEALGAVEEQVDRTVQSGLGSTTKLSPDILFLGVMAPMAAITLLSAVFSNERRPSAPLGLSAETVGKLGENAKALSTDSEKINFIYNYLAATLVTPETKPSIFAQYAFDYRTYLIGIPLAVALVAAVAAVRWFSPRRVFVWGDYEEHYNKLVERRKFLWYGVVGALVIGVLGNIFMLGVTPSLGPK